MRRVLFISSFVAGTVLAEDELDGVSAFVSVSEERKRASFLIIFFGTWLEIERVVWMGGENAWMAAVTPRKRRA